MTYYFALGIEYDGTKFCGTQAQHRQRTVQQDLEQAVSKVADERVPILFSSRTDSGVHATSQVVAFRTNARRSEHNWQYGINTYLPSDISVHTVVSVEDQFDARRSTRWRRYLYIWGECEYIPALGRNAATWVSAPLRSESMNTQAQVLLGEHDFSSFRGANCQSRSPRRFVHSISVFRIGSYVILDIVANAFLLRMVRNIAGALLEIGQSGTIELKNLLESQDRTLAPPTAPAEGLYLVQICYPDYPTLSKLHIPRILGTGAQLKQWDLDDFESVRERIELCEP